MRKLLSVSMLMVFSIALVLVAAGCGTKTAKYTEADTKKTLEVSVGQQFTITLRGNETTGFEWQMGKDINSKIVKKVSDKYTADNTGLVGSGGDHVWTFKAVAVGETRITLNYLRPWELTAAPSKTLKYKVKVK